MKLFKAFTIFYSRRYRAILGGGLVCFLLWNVLVPLFGESELQQVVSTMFLALMGILLLYGDMEVFAGIYNREGGQIVSCQSSFYGEKTITLGVLADRITIFLWILGVGIVQFVWGKAFFPQSIWSMITGCALVYSIVSIGVNLNRFFATTLGVMFASMVEGSLASAASLVFLLIYPVGTWWSAVLSVALAVLVTVATVLIASHFVKRSYCDE